MKTEMETLKFQGAPLQMLGLMLEVGMITEEELSELVTKLSDQGRGGV